MKNLKNPSLIIALMLSAFVAVAQPAGNSLLFNGINNYINVPDNAALDFSDSLSVEFWINIVDVADCVVFSKGICQNANYGYYVSVDSGRVVFQWSPNGSCAGGVANYAITDSAVVFPFQCTHVAIVFDTSNVDIYINGILVSDSLIIVNSTPIHNSSEPLRIGVYKKVNPIDLVAWYSGEMDELRFWNYRLSASEINSRMNTTLTGNEPGLVAYYDFEEPGTGSGVSILNKCSATGSILDGTTFGDAVSPVHVPRCSVVGIDETGMTSPISIYPNPSKGNFTIDLRNSIIAKEHSLFIRNILTQIIFKTKTNQEKVEINLNELPGKGIYFLEIRDEKNELIDCKKLIIN